MQYKSIIMVITIILLLLNTIFISQYNNLFIYLVFFII